MNRILYLRIIGILLTAMLLVLTAGCSGVRKAEELRDLGVQAYSKGEYAQAHELFDEALQADRGKAGELQYDILRFRAECELRTGDFDSARSTYEVLLELDDAEGGRELYEGVLEEIDSLEAFDEACQTMQSGDYDEAFRLFDELDGVSGSSVGRLSLFNKAVCAEYMHDYSGALGLFEEYLEHFPDDADARREYDFLKTR